MNISEGDIFLIPIESGEFVPGQIIAEDKRGMLCISCGLFDQRVSSQNASVELNLDFKKCFSTLLVTPKSFDKDKWIIIGNQKLVIPKKFYPYEDLRKRKKPGSRIYDRQTVEEFVNAYHALLPWDNYYKPDFLDELLLNTSKKPKNLIYSK